MPISDESVEFIIKSQAETIKALQEENAVLVAFACGVSKEIGETTKGITPPESIGGVGRMPWNIRKSLLEKTYRKPKLSEISGIKDLDIDEDRAVQFENIKKFEELKLSCYEDLDILGAAETGIKEHAS